MWRPSPQPGPHPRRNHHGNRQHKPSWRCLWWPLWLPQSAGTDRLHQYISCAEHCHWAYCQHSCCSHTDPNAHESVLQDNPGQEKDEGLVAAVESGHVCGSQLLQGQQVQVVGQCPQDGERRCSLYKKLESHAILSKELAALPEQTTQRKWLFQPASFTIIVLYVRLFRPPTMKNRFYDGNNGC